MGEGKGGGIGGERRGRMNVGKSGGGGILRELRSHGEKDDEGDLKRKRGIYCTALIQIFLFFEEDREGCAWWGGEGLYGRI